MIAAILTVVGYSVNDKIVIFDRIRENRGRMTDVSPQIINESISQTLSRTLLTGLTTIVTILIMYTIGGDGIHGFNFVLLIGIVMGTYSSFAIAAQLLLSRSQIALAKA
jgi:SecD/SecF fusion protein